MGDLTYQEALDEEPDFCDWAFEQSQGEDPSGRLLEFAEWLKEQGFPRPILSGMVGFGKYKRLTYQQVLDEDPSFCDYIFEQSQGDDPGPEMLEFGEWLKSTGFRVPPASTRSASASTGT